MGGELSVWNEGPGNERPQDLENTRAPGLALPTRSVSVVNAQLPRSASPSRLRQAEGVGSRWVGARGAGRGRREPRPLMR